MRPPRNGASGAHRCTGQKPSLVIAMASENALTPLEWASPPFGPYSGTLRRPQLGAFRLRRLGVHRLGGAIWGPLKVVPSFGLSPSISL